ATLDLGDGLITPGTTGSIVGNVSIASTGEFIFDRNNNLTFAGNISGQGQVLQVGANVVTLTGNNTYSGGTLVDFGVLAFSKTNALGSGTITVQDGGELRATGTVVLNNTVHLGRNDHEILSASPGNTFTINNLDASRDTVVIGSPGNTGTVV